MKQMKCEIGVSNELIIGDVSETKACDTCNSTLQMSSNNSDRGSKTIAMVISYPDIRLKKELESLKKKGYNVSLIIWQRSWPFSVDPDVDVKSLKIDVPVGNFKTLFYFPIWWIFMSYWLFKMEWDVIHSVNFDTYIFALLTAKIKRKPVVYDIFDYYGDVMVGFLRPMITFMDDLLMRYTDVIIIADSSRISQIAKGIKNHIVTINNTPDEVHFSKVEGNRSIKDEMEGFTIFLGGKITEQRGTDIILTAFKDIEDAYLVIKGFCSEEEYKKYLLNMTESMNNVDIDLDGVPYDEIIQGTVNCDLTLALYDPTFPNNRYASPNKLFEAMAAGIPIIVNENTSMADIVQAENCGMVIPYNDVDAVRKAIFMMKNNPQLKEKMGANGRKACLEKYNWSLMEKRLVNIYDFLLFDDKKDFDLI